MTNFNFNLFNNLVKEIPSNLRRFIARKLKRIHAIPRAHQVIEKTATDRGKRAPLPGRIQEKIDEILKNQPDLLKAVSSDQNESLLERLKKVFVTSTGENKDMFDKSRLTPLQYNLFKPDVIEEYKENIPEGKFSLKQAEIFLQEFKRHPDQNTVESLSKKLQIEPKNLMCMLTHTKVFKVTAPINKKSDKPTLLQSTTESILPSIIETETDEDKMYRILDTRSTKFQQYYEEKLGLKNQEFSYKVKNPAIRKVLINLDIVKDKQVSTEGGKPDELVAQKGVVVAPDGKSACHIITSDGKTQTILVSDLKRGEDPNALEELPELPSSEATFSSRYQDKTMTNREKDEKLASPDYQAFDVFKAMEEQDRKARKEARRLKRIEQEEKEQNSEHKLEDEQRKVTIPEKISSESS